MTYMVIREVNSRYQNNPLFLPLIRHFAVKSTMHGQGSVPHYVRLVYLRREPELAHFSNVFK